MDLKRLLEIRRRKEELRSLVDSKEATTEQINAAIAEVDKLDAEENELEKSEKQPNQIEKRGTTILTMTEKKENLGLDSAEYRSAFFKTLAGGELSEVEKRAMSTNSSSAGVAVPTTTHNKILEKIEEEAIVYNLVSVSHLKGNIVIPLEKTTNPAERKAEGEEGTIVEDTLGELKLGVKKYIKLVQITCELEAQAIDALEGYIVSKLAKKLAIAIDEDIINGDGVKGCKGILNTITPYGVKTAGTITYDDLCYLFSKVAARVKKRAKLLINTETLYNDIATIKDDNKRPIFDLQHQKVLGRDYEECDDLPNGIILFGDMKEYQLNWNKEVEITKSTEVAFKSGDTVFRGLALVDGGVADLGAIHALDKSVTRE